MESKRGPSVNLDRRQFLTMLVGVSVGMSVLSGCAPGERQPPPRTTPVTSTGPQPNIRGLAQFGDVVARRRSIRAFADTPIAAEDVAAMAWAAQGITDESTGYRASPSAGALYPLDLYSTKDEGRDHWIPGVGAFERLSDSDEREELAASAGQGFISSAPVVFVVTGDYERTASKYGDRAERYVHMEAGHAAQNLLLTATALGLGGVPVGAFVDSEVQAVLGLDERQTPLYIIPVGGPVDGS